jgi:hypothetical protein
MDKQDIHVEVLVPAAPGRESRGRILVGGLAVAVYRSAEEESALLHEIQRPIMLPVAELPRRRK